MLPYAETLMPRWKKLTADSEKVNENLARGDDPQHCKAFLDAYLIDIFAEQGEPAELETKAIYEITTVESLLNRLTMLHLCLVYYAATGSWHLLRVVKYLLHVVCRYRLCTLFDTNAKRCYVGGGFTDTTTRPDTEPASTGVDPNFVVWGAL
jgi:hypothetical protein